LLDDLFNARLICIKDFANLSFYKGAVAQLGERMTGSHEVRGSIPLGSTNRIIANSKMRQVFSEGKISRFAAETFAQSRAY
jgi:hypothetical protein